MAWASWRRLRANWLTFSFTTCVAVSAGSAVEGLLGTRASLSDTRSGFVFAVAWRVSAEAGPTFGFLPLRRKRSAIKVMSKQIAARAVRRERRPGWFRLIAKNQFPIEQTEAVF